MGDHDGTVVLAEQRSIHQLHVEVRAVIAADAGAQEFLVGIQCYGIGLAETEESCGIGAGNNRQGGMVLMGICLSICFFEGMDVCLEDFMDDRLLAVSFEDLPGYFFLRVVLFREQGNLEVPEAFVSEPFRELEDGGISHIQV